MRVLVAANSVRVLHLAVSYLFHTLSVCERALYASVLYALSRSKAAVLYLCATVRLSSATTIMYPSRYAHKASLAQRPLTALGAGLRTGLTTRHATAIVTASRSQLQSANVTAMGTAMGTVMVTAMVRARPAGRGWPARSCAPG